MLEMHAMVVTNLRLALSTMMTENSRSARELVNAKRRLNDFERASSRNHLARLGGADFVAMRASVSFLAMLRDLKQVNSHLASIGYAIADPPDHSAPRPPVALVTDATVTDAIEVKDMD